VFVSLNVTKLAYVIYKPFKWCPLYCMIFQNHALPLKNQYDNFILVIGLKLNENGKKFVH
jgi:hypothetical protein